MIHSTYKTSASGRIGEGLADRIKVRYTPDEIVIHCLEGSNDYEYTLSKEWEDDAIVEFRCDKFSLRAE